MCFKLMHLHSSAQGFLNHSSIRVVDISLCIDLLHVYPQTGIYWTGESLQIIYEIAPSVRLLAYCVCAFFFFCLLLLATDFTLKPSDIPDSEYPVQLASSDRGYLWYKKDTKFKTPKGWTQSVCQYVCVRLFVSVCLYLYQSACLCVPVFLSLLNVWVGTFNINSELLTHVCPSLLLQPTSDST